MDNEPHATPAHPPVQFSLRSLLITLAFAALLLTPIRWFGTFYVMSIVVSLALFAGSLWAYRANRPGAMFGLSMLGFFLAIPVMSMSLALHSLLNGVGTVVCLLAKVRPRTASIVLGGVLFAAYGFIFWTASGQIIQLNAVLAKYPIVSLDERLAFEATQDQQQDSHDSDQLGEPVRINLNSLEAHLVDYGGRDRAYALGLLHNQTYQQFALAAGFGISRMGGVRAEWIALDERRPIQLPLSVNHVSLARSQAELEKLHQDANFEFLDPRRMGYIPDHRLAAGFEAHGFTEFPIFSNCCSQPAATWQVSRLELVSLLRHETPQVYVTSRLPQMDQLADIPHRPLNEFEQSALPKLEFDEDFVVDQQPKRILMLGAVRAASACAKCHETNRGKLLGAFSYELTPIEESTAMR